MNLTTNQTNPKYERFIRDGWLRIVATPCYHAQMENFESLNLSAPLMRALADLEFTKPSPIQIEALPVLLGEPTDFVGLAATGTGKTAAFGIPLLEKIDPQIRAVQALVVCPTRELVLQVAGQIGLLGKHLNVHALPIYGGADYSTQIHGLKRGAQVVVGTPGRLIDHLDRGTMKLDQLRVVVLDEADEMISMGFREDMERLMESAPRETSQRWMFSATMSSNVRRVADDFLVKPKMVQVNRTEMLSSTVEQYYYMTQEKNKAEVLVKLIDAAEDFYGVVFCQTKVLVTNLQVYLNERGFKVDSLHGDKTQGAREQTLRAFRDKRVRVLICTDVAARGLDIKDITHVINYSIPRELDNYVHRIGRTARSGKNGLALSLVTPSHRHLLNRIERMTKSRILEGVIPTRRAIGAKKISHLLGKFSDQKFHERATALLDDAWKIELAKMTPEEVAGRFVTLMYPEIFNDNAERPTMAPRSPDQVVPPSARPTRRDDRAKRFGSPHDAPSFRNRSDESESRPAFRPEGKPRPSFRPPPERTERSERIERPSADASDEHPNWERPERGESAISSKPAFRPPGGKPLFKKSFDRPARDGEDRGGPQKVRPKWTASKPKDGGNYPPRKKSATAGSWKKKTTT